MLKMLGLASRKAQDEKSETLRKRAEFRLSQFTQPVCRRGEEGRNCSPFHPCHDICPVYTLPPVSANGE
jgi:hypothetical protein